MVTSWLNLFQRSQQSHDMGLSTNHHLLQNDWLKATTTLCRTDWSAWETMAPTTSTSWCLESHGMALLSLAAIASQRHTLVLIITCRSGDWRTPVCNCVDVLSWNTYMYTVYTIEVNVYIYIYYDRHVSNSYSIYIDSMYKYIIDHRQTILFA